MAEGIVIYAEAGANGTSVGAAEKELAQAAIPARGVGQRHARREIVGPGVERLARFEKGETRAGGARRAYRVGRKDRLVKIGQPAADLKDASLALPAQAEISTSGSH